MADVYDFLTMSPEDIPETITLPEGSYDLVIWPFCYTTVGENQNQIVRLHCKAQAVLESDITDADLENCDGTRLEFWATKKALRQGNPVISLKAFLTKTLGMSGNSFGEMLEQTIGQTYSGIIKHEMVGRHKDILQASVSRILTKH